MKQRIVTGLIVTIVLFMTVAFGEVGLFIVGVGASAIGLIEFYSVFKAKHNPIIVQGLIYLAIFFGMLLFSDKSDNIFKYLLMINVIFFITLFVQAVVYYKKYNIMDIFITYAGYMYVVQCIGMLYLISKVPNTNFFYFLLVFMIASGADTGGYFIGLRFGKKKLCEAISPKKTVEGFWGGILASVLFSSLLAYIYIYFDLITFKYLNAPLGIIISIVLIILLSVLAQVGDLAASSIKRFMGVKDFGNLMPGHGGLLDRIDSVIFISPIMYLLLVIFI